VPGALIAIPGNGSEECSDATVLLVLLVLLAGVFGKVNLSLSLHMLYCSYHHFERCNWLTIALFSVDLVLECACAIIFILKKYSAGRDSTFFL